MAKFIYTLFLTIILVLFLFKVQASDCELIKPLYIKWIGEKKWQDNCCDISMKILCQNNKIQKIDFSLSDINAEINENDITIIESLKYLKDLDLSYNSMYGNLPDSLSVLSLNSIDLSNNNFVGSCPKIGARISNVENNDFILSKFDNEKSNIFINRRDVREDEINKISKQEDSELSNTKSVIYGLMLLLVLVVLCVCAYEKCHNESQEKDEYFKKAFEMNNIVIEESEYSKSTIPKMNSDYHHPYTNIESYEVVPPPPCQIK